MQKLSSSHLIISLGLMLCIFLGGCSNEEIMPINLPGPANAQQDNLAMINGLTQQQQTTGTGAYEGSLWSGIASWGNLLRDNRARYPGDLLTVTDLQQISDLAKLPVEEANFTPEQLALSPEARYQYILQQISREQNGILSNVNQIEVEVLQSLPNGNMMVFGSYPPVYRHQNRVKYVVSLSGIVQPSDVSADNSISALKVSRADYRITRFVTAPANPPNPG